MPPVSLERDRLRETLELRKEERAWAKDRQKEREGENAERQGEGRERGGTRKEGQRGRESWERTAREPLQRLSAAKKRCEREC